ncbi:hypothetical protein ACFU53_33555 [Streptomyces sp. NPDC057474]|uniref:hypothetical protein n=1 Tax=Streptomyces sp. NPDC057474 TaxID=3346144 RepID=UPI0036B4F4CD
MRGGGTARRRRGRSVRGYEWSKDRVIPVTDDELADVLLPTAKAMGRWLVAGRLGTVQYEAAALSAAHVV